MKNLPVISALPLTMMLALSTATLTGYAQSASAPDMAASAGSSNKAGKPSVDAAASQSGAASKKPAKPGTQSGPTPASAPK